ncbi:MAG: hypothetical protein ACRC9L_07465 [Brevinema sp.]
MGLFLRSNGYYYIQYNRNGRRVQKSLKTKNKFFAKDLYHAFLREKLLKELFPPTPPSPQFLSFEAYKDSEKPLKSLVVSYKEYLKDCVSRGIGKRSIEEKNHFLKLITRYKLTRFEALTPDNVNKFWDELWLDIQRLASKDKDFLLYLQVLYYTY